MASKKASVEDLFEAALPLSRDERGRLLDEECRDAPGLRQAVEVLLSAHEQAGSFLARPILAPVFETQTDAGLPQSESHVGNTFQVGCVIAERFTIHRFIARGGMGEVYEAWDSHLQERIAIKTIRSNLAQHSEVIERFRREVKQARAITHPNLCRVHELFVFEDEAGSKVTFLCMEFLEGPTLSQYLHHRGPLDPPTAFKLVQQMVDGLNSTHALGVVHRDFKSRNIMLVNSGIGTMRVVITDLGLAVNVLAPQADFEGRKDQGTPDYMAPEQKPTGNVTALADQYALGVVMCEMITGSLPVLSDGGSSRKTAGLKLPRKHCPARWISVIERCLSPRPEDRFSNLTDVLRALGPPSQMRWLWTIPAATALLTAGTVIWALHGRSSSDLTSLAVLPIHNAAGDAQLGYVGAGLTEALTNDLAGMPGLQVKAESVVERTSTQIADPEELGKRLHVGSLVSGSLFNTGGHLRLSIEIINISDGSQIWGKTYEGDTSTLAELQNEISTDVAYYLKVRLDPDTKARLKRQYDTNPAAYDTYLKGRYLLAQRTPQTIRQASGEFQHALEFDSHYAPAFAGLADCYSLMAFFGEEKPVAVLTLAMQASEQALQLDSTLGEAYASRAFARTFLSYDWEKAEDDYKRAMELNPNYLIAHTWYGLTLLLPLERIPEATGQLAYAQDAEPNSLMTDMGVATLDEFSDRFDEAMVLLKNRLRISPGLEPAIEHLAFDYIATGSNAEAVRLLETEPCAQEAMRDRHLILAIAYARSGNRAQARRHFQLTADAVSDTHFPYYEAAIYYTALNNHPKALQMLETAFNKRDPELVFLSVDPYLSELRTEPAFRGLQRKMHL